MSYYPSIDEFNAAYFACNLDTNWDMSGFQNLLNKGWNVNHGFGHAGTGLTMLASGNKLPAVRFLLEHKADPNRGRGGGGVYTAVELASMYADREVVVKLLEFGATIKGGMSMLQAARRDRVDVMETLIGAGLHVDEMPDNPFVWDNERMRADFGAPLHGAAGYGQSHAITWLLQRGANKNLKNPAGLTPEEVAKEKGHEECVNLLQTA